MWGKVTANRRNSTCEGRPVGKMVALLGTPGSVGWLGRDFGKRREVDGGVAAR